MVFSHGWEIGPWTRVRRGIRLVPSVDLQVRLDYFKENAVSPFSSPEAAILLVSTENHDLWPTSGQVQLRKSTIHGLPVTLRMLLVKSDKSDWFWSQSIVFTKPFKTGMSLDRARGSPEVVIFSADQKDRGLWGRECGQLGLSGRARKGWITSAHVRDLMPLAGANDLGAIANLEKMVVFLESFARRPVYGKKVGQLHWKR